MIKHTTPGLPDEQKYMSLNDPRRRASMSDTPRSDEVAQGIDSNDHRAWSSLCYKLERELAEARKDAERWRRYSETGWPKPYSNPILSSMKTEYWTQMINGKTYKFDSANEAIDAALSQSSDNQPDIRPRVAKES